MNICAVTMVSGDYFFLQKWIVYYGRLVGYENLFIVAHGNDLEVQRLAKHCNLLTIPKEEKDSLGLEGFEDRRWDFLNKICNGLNNYFDYVICVDVDEFLVVDPARFDCLEDLLSQAGRPPVLTAFGLDVVHVAIEESVELDPKRPILSQRPHVRVAPFYSKPAIASISITRANGNHFANLRKLILPAGLYIFHLKFSDFNLCLNTALARHKSRCGVADSETDSGFGRCCDDFPLREALERQFASFVREAVYNDFRFDAVVEHFHATWRPRRSWVNPRFWLNMVSPSKFNYQRYWRFDNTTIHPGVYKLPERFQALF